MVLSLGLRGFIFVPVRRERMGLWIGDAGVLG